LSKPKPAPFAFRRKILTEMLQDPEYVEKWNNCVSMKDCEDCLMAFCKKKGYEIANINIKGKKK
jgi:hypothetical protein